MARDSFQVALGWKIFFSWLQAEILLMRTLFLELRNIRQGYWEIFIITVFWRNASWLLLSILGMQADTFRSWGLIDISAGLYWFLDFMWVFYLDQRQCGRDHAFIKYLVGKINPFIIGSLSLTVGDKFNLRPRIRELRHLNRQYSIQCNLQLVENQLFVILHISFCWNTWFFRDRSGDMAPSERFVWVPMMKPK